MISFQRKAVDGLVTVGIPILPFSDVHIGGRCSLGKTNKKRSTSPLDTFSLVKNSAILCVCVVPMMLMQGLRMIAGMGLLQRLTFSCYPL